MDITTNPLPIRCDCGRVQGRADLRHNRAPRAVCYCGDCRMFVHFLARGDTVLDPRGGTEVVPMSQGLLRFEAGRDQLACVRLTARGILRWYTRCCHTPIGNTPPNRHLPYLGLIHACIDYGATGRTPEALVGPVAWRVHGRDPADGETAAGVHESVPPGLLIRVACRALGWRLRGDHRHSPFFDSVSGRPIVEPHVLSADERAALQASGN